ncbi:calcium-binding mitochondrial carrier protein SCaMC-2-like [Crotalus adamanteus]|uniref:Calcium-binding mitochondrial carrier protein SCaMC-2-like n=1 Tax=Crotalus adamanteus TaxID=8729 RepID=A0AAW1BT06_CROAD
MPAGARRSLASPAVVNGVLCQCGGVSAPPSSPSASSSSSGEAASRFLAEHERRLYSLFVQLDVNRDGALCVHDLAVGLERLGLHRSERDLWDHSRLLGC